jgi:hypothetical protein
MITRRELEKLLSDETQASTAEYHLSHTNRGPGYLSKMLLLEGRANAWQQIEYKPAVHKKKKIILSNQFFHQLNYSTLRASNQDRCQDLIQALVANYDVYLWPEQANP